MNRVPGQLVTGCIVLAVIAGGYYYRHTIVEAANIVKNIIFPIKPCEEPIPYSLGEFDTRFGMSKTQFLKAVSDAEDIWESEIGKDLFQYSEEADLKINLVYDYRQKTTVDLARVDTVIKTGKIAYDTAKEKYDKLVTSYASQKNALDAAIRAHEARKKAYDEQVAYWNDKGGAPKETYDELEAERRGLNEDVDRINQAKNDFNKLVETVNATAASLNQLARQLNINVKTYNTIGATAGEEFSEGEYVMNSDGEYISIYQFENNDKLVRVLAHELGHALGLDHVDDSKAIMYRLNEGSSRVPTMADVEALKTLCVAAL